MNNPFEDRDLPNWLTIIGRFGFIAKGLIYITVGFLALKISLGIAEGELYNAKEILDEVIYESYGIIAIIFCFLSLLAHAVYRMMKGYLDLNNKGKDLSALFHRGKDIIVGFVYAGLSFAALQILFGAATTSMEERSDFWITEIMSWPFGIFIILAVALGTLIIGFYNFYIALQDEVENDFDYSSISATQRKWFSMFGRIGKAAWGVVSFMVAFLLYEAATSGGTGQEVGFGEALQALANQPYGYWILGITACGLLIYGLYQLTLSYYRRIAG